jgi:Kef-type K+ transport system membrane component KefB
MEAFIQLTVFLILIILLSRAAVLLSRRIDVPAIAIHLVVGILIGPSLFNLLESPVILGTWGSTPPTFLHSVLKILAEVGLIQLMFLAGLHTDWRKLKANLSFISRVSLWSFLLTSIGIILTSVWFVHRWPEALALSAISAASSFGMTIYHLKEMEILDSEAGNLISGAAIGSGLLSVLLMIASHTANYSLQFGALKGIVAVSWFVGKLVMFFAISYFLTSRFLNRVGKAGFEKRPRQTLIGYLLLVAALYAWGAMHFGSFAAVGVAALGGALLGISDLGLKEKMTKASGSVPVSLPIGVLAVILGMEVNLKEVGAHLVFLFTLLATVLGTKWMGVRIATRTQLRSSRVRRLLLFGGLPQGELGMLIGAYLFSRGLLNPSQFNVAITVVVLLTILSTVLMRIAHANPPLASKSKRG